MRTSTYASNGSLDLFIDQVLIFSFDILYYLQAGKFVVTKRRSLHENVL